MWKGVLPQNNMWSPQLGAKLAALALEESRKDWCNECVLFNVTNSHHITQDWHEDAWENIITNTADKRSEHLDKQCAISEPSRTALFGDGVSLPELGLPTLRSPIVRPRASLLQEFFCRIKTGSGKTT